MTTDSYDVTFTSANSELGYDGNVSIDSWPTSVNVGQHDNDTLELMATTVMGLEDYLHYSLGPPRLDLEVVIPISVIYGLIFVSGLVGNVCTCLVIVKNRHMHTSTNCYLFNLALADVLTLLLGLPNDLSVYWQQYPYLFNLSVCKTRAMVSEMTSYASVLTIVFFTAERYVAICHPFQTQKLANIPRVIGMIAAVWAVALVCSVPFAVFTRLHYVEYPPGTGLREPSSAFCAIIDSENRRYAPLFQCSFVVFFVAPLLFISALYIMIGLRLREVRNARRLSSAAAERGAQASTSGVINILTAVVVTFFLCYAPFHSQRLLVAYLPHNKWSNSMRRINETMYHVAGCCYYINCTANPLLYNVMSKKYRKAFERTLKCSFRNQPQGGAVYGVRHQDFRRSIPAVMTISKEAMGRRPGMLHNGCSKLGLLQKI